jgi:hypothetical protein
MRNRQSAIGSDDFVGRAPWPAVDPLVDLLGHRKSRTRESGADGGVRPTFGCGSTALVGQTLSSVNPAIGYRPHG